MKFLKECLGECIGTFILVFIGCGSVALAVLYGTFESLLEVAIVWGLGVTIAIFASRRLCPSHLNPAVSVAFWMQGELPFKKLPVYFLFQTLGAFLAAGLLYFFVREDIAAYELSNFLIRGEPNSYHSAVMFGEFFPNPGYENDLHVSAGLACMMEALGTCLLVFTILWLAARKLNVNLFPLLVGLTVTLIICFVAPYTQAGLNPARDFGPRLFAYLAGWENAAFSSASLSFLTVYILSPIGGGVIAVFIYRLIFKRKVLA